MKLKSAAPDLRHVAATCKLITLFVNDVFISLWGASSCAAKNLGRAQELIHPSNPLDLSGFGGAQPGDLTVIEANFIPPVVQGVRGDPAKDFAYSGAGDPTRTLLGQHSLPDELQGAGLELGKYFCGIIRSSLRK